MRTKCIGLKSGNKWLYRQDQCHYCNKKIKGDGVWEAYSRHMSDNGPFAKFHFHKKCVKKALSENAHAFEEIDRSCNDCKYFKGKKWITWRSTKARDGWCGKKNKGVVGLPQEPMDMPCFEHRKGNKFFNIKTGINIYNI